MTDWLTQPAGQVALFAVVEAALLAWLYRSRRRPALVAVIALPVVAAAVVVIDLVRLSPRERVDRILGEVRRAAVADDPAAVLRHVDPDYDYQGLTFEALSAWLPPRLEWLRLTSVRITEREFTTVSRRRITARLSVTAAGRPGGFAFTSRSRWRLTFVPLEDRWVIAEIEPTEVDGRSFAGLGELP